MDVFVSPSPSCFVRVRFARPNYASDKPAVKFALLALQPSRKLTAAIALGKNSPPGFFCSASPFRAGGRGLKPRDDVLKGRVLFSVIVRNGGSLSGF